MNEYTTAITEVDQFLTQNPTLTHQRRALGANGRLADVEAVDNFIGEKVSVAGSKFLERIHSEIFNALPTHERDAIASDLESLSKGDTETILVKVDENGKPELTPEYLRSIGREDILEWGTDRP